MCAGGSICTDETRVETAKVVVGRALASGRINTWGSRRAQCLGFKSGFLFPRLAEHMYEHRAFALALACLVVSSLLG